MCANAPDTEGKTTKVPRTVFKLKIEHKCKAKTIAEGLQQTKMYLDRVGEKAGHRLIFNRNPKASWRSKLHSKEHSYAGCHITVWGM